MVTLLLLCRRLGSMTRSFCVRNCSVACPPPGIRPGIKNVLISGEDACKGQGRRPLFAVRGAVTGLVISVEGGPPCREGKPKAEGAEHQSHRGGDLRYGNVFSSEGRPSSSLRSVVEVQLHGWGCSACSAASLLVSITALCSLCALGFKNCFHPPLRLARCLVFHAVLWARVVVFFSYLSFASSPLCFYEAGPQGCCSPWHA